MRIEYAETSEELRHLLSSAQQQQRERKQQEETAQASQQQHLDTQSNMTHNITLLHRSHTALLGQLREAEADRDKVLVQVEAAQDSMRVAAAEVEALDVRHAQQRETNWTQLQQQQQQKELTLELSALHAARDAALLHTSHAQHTRNTLDHEVTTLHTAASTANTALKIAQDSVETLHSQQARLQARVRELSASAESFQDALEHTAHEAREKALRVGKDLAGASARYQEVSAQLRVDTLTATHCNAFDPMLQFTATRVLASRSLHGFETGGQSHCNTLQHTATHLIARCNALQHAAAHCNTLQHTAMHFNTLQHTATHCSTLQHTAPHYTTLQHTATHCSTLQHTAAHCSTLQHTATHCNTLRHTQVARESTPWWARTASD